MTPLNVVTDCKGCGHCCEGLGVPPFDYDENGEPFEDGVPDWFDRFVPDEAMSILRATLDSDQPWKGEPCCWFDREKRECRFYNARPSSCERFDRGNPFCLEILEFHGLRAEEE